MANFYSLLLFVAVILFLTFVIGFANIPWFIWVVLIIFGIYYLSKGRR